MEKYDKALENYVITQSLNPSFSAVYICLGNIYIVKKDFNVALNYYEESITLNPNNPIAFFSIGRAYIELGNYNKSIDSLKQAARLGHQAAQNNQIRCCLMYCLSREIHLIEHQHTYHRDQL